MFHQKFELINLILFIFLFILSFFQDRYFILSLVFCSVGMMLNVYLNYINKSNSLSDGKTQNSSMNEKNAILKDLDKELKRRKKEDDFLRN